MMMLLHSAAFNEKKIVWDKLFVLILHHVFLSKSNKRNKVY